MPVRKGPDCVGEELRRFKKGEMHSGKKGPVVTSKNQALAVALNVCGESKYSETLQSMGFPAETADQVVALFAEIDWKKQFKTGKAPAPENPENIHTGVTKAKDPASAKIAKGPGDMGRRKVNSESGMIAGPALPKGPGNPQGGSSKDVSGMRMLG